MANPNPAMITNEMWALWEGCSAVLPGVRLSGIYANKVCYHNSVKANKANWPGAYCIKLPLDLKGPQDKARAIDLTLSDAEMKKRTGLLRAAALHPNDDRLLGVREFYGTLNGTTVYGLSRNTDSGTWVSVTSDTSHLWHIHISEWSFYCNQWPAQEMILSVLSGETWEAWLARKDLGGMDYYVISDAGPHLHEAGKVGGGTYQHAKDIDTYNSWKAAFPGPERFITHAQFNAGILGKNVDELGVGGGGLAPHTHDVPISITVSTTGSGSGTASSGPAKA